MNKKRLRRMRRAWQWCKENESKSTLIAFAALLGIFDLILRLIF